MEQTYKLELPYLMAAQAQKHVTHNEALRKLDAVVHIAVAQRETLALPEPPAEGMQVIVSPNAAASLSHHRGKVATWQDGAWAFHAPQKGWTAWVSDEAALVVYDGVDWVACSRPQSVNPMRHAGINTTADDYNRLAVRAPATLLSHEGGDHRVVVNKAAPTDTAAHIFQTGYSGRAEMGLAGSDRFSIKVSPDGEQWNNAVTVAPDTGTVSMPQGLKLGGTPSVLKVYEEGEWTPVLKGSSAAGTPNYVISNGSYVRIGSLVLAVARLVWNSLGNMSGSVKIANLPFTVRPGTRHRFPMTASWYNHLNMNVGSTMLGGFSEPGSDEIRLWGALASYEGINRFLTPDELSASGEISFSITYICADHPS